MRVEMMGVVSGFTWEPDNVKRLKHIAWIEVSDDMPRTWVFPIPSAVSVASLTDAPTTRPVLPTFTLTKQELEPWPWSPDKPRIVYAVASVSDGPAARRWLDSIGWTSV